MDDRAKADAVEIHGSILNPRRGEPDAAYLVIVSAFPVEPGRPLGAYPYKCREAATHDEAVDLRRRLTDELRRDLELLGCDVRWVS